MEATVKIYYESRIVRLQRSEAELNSIDERI